MNEAWWWPERDLNPRRRPFQGRALPLSYLALGNPKNTAELQWNCGVRGLARRMPEQRSTLRSIANLSPACLPRSPASQPLS